MAFLLIYESSNEADHKIESHVYVKLVHGGPGSHKSHMSKYGIRMRSSKRVAARTPI